jgi:hypothetical protein
VPIQLSPEQERVVDKAIHAGLISIPEDLVGVSVETIRQRLEARESSVSVIKNGASIDDWSRQLHDSIYSHANAAPPLPDEALDRESIYEGRGL